MTVKYISHAVAFAMAMAIAASVAMAHDVSHAPQKTFDSATVEETAFGRAGDPGKVTRTIRVGMSEAMRFTPSSFTVKPKETVRFVIHNGGKMLHEMVIGTTEELQKHAELMRQFPGMEHDEAYMAHVKPGKRGEIVWHFTRPGEYSFACLVPGHFEAGMVGRLVVR
jgi:uncharacterized cupredoxin-like copper-binding protein